MKKIIVFLALLISLFVGYGQPRTSSSSRPAPSSTTVRTPSPSRSSAPATYSPSRTTTQQSRQPSQTVRPSTQPSRPAQAPSSSVSSRNIYNTRPSSVGTQPTTRPATPSNNGSNMVRTNPPTDVKRDGHKPGDGHNPPPPNGGQHHHNGHGSVPPGYNPPPRPPHHHPYNPHYHHPYYHRDVYLHRVYWNPWVPVFYLDGFWFYTHNYYYIDYGVRTTYVYTYNNTNTVQIIDYVVDDIYTYCIQKMGCDRYFRVYDKSNRLVAQQKIHWRYNELIYDTISGGVWCKGNRDNFNLFFLMDENGQLVCYSE